MGKIIQIAGLLLAGCLLAGCAGAGTAGISGDEDGHLVSSSTSPASVSAASIGPAPVYHWTAETRESDYQKAAPWKQVFYDVAASQVNVINKVELHRVDEQWYMTLWQIGLARDGRRRFNLYEFEDGAARLLCEGEADWVNIHRETLRPVAGTAAGVVMYRDNEEELLFKWVKKDGETALLSLLDGEIYNNEDLLVKQPVNRLPLSNVVGTLYLHSLNDLELDEWEAIKTQQLAEFFLDAYQPNIPVGAPAWVKAYLQHFRQQSIAPYLPHKVYAWPVQRVTREGKIYDLTLLQSVDNTAVPLYAEGAGYHFYNEKTRYCLSTLGLSDRAWQDERGQYVLFSVAFFTADFYHPSEDGLQFIFSSGRLETTLYGYCDGEYLDIGLETARQAALAKYGYHGALTDIQEYTYPLPEKATWPEYEAAIIDALCAHAKAVGQWDDGT